MSDLVLSPGSESGAFEVTEATGARVRTFYKRMDSELEVRTRQAGGGGGRVPSVCGMAWDVRAAYSNLTSPNSPTPTSSPPLHSAH